MKQRVLITVKTYPTLSRKYGETVCTAGVRPDGSWVRIYPVPFRRLTEEERYRKYDWIDCELIRNTSDPRPETFRPADPSELVPIAHMGTEREWQERRELLLQTAKVYDSLQVLVQEAKVNTTSLAVFKPKRVTGFAYVREEREWDAKKLIEMRGHYSQLGLFEDNAWRRTFQIIPKLPFSFSYRFEDSLGTKSQLTILDWEIGALYWNCLRTSGGDEDQALAKVRQKYFDEFTGKDIHFFLGTTQQFHFVGPNPWVIVGVLPIPFETQPKLL